MKGVNGRPRPPSGERHLAAAGKAALFVLNSVRQAATVTQVAGDSD